MKEFGNSLAYSACEVQKQLFFLSDITELMRLSVAELHAYTAGRNHYTFFQIGNA